MAKVARVFVKTAQIYLNGKSSPKVVHDFEVEVIHNGNVTLNLVSEAIKNHFDADKVQIGMGSYKVL